MGALLVDCPTHYGMQEVGVVEGLEDEGFDCPEAEEALINEVPGAPAPLILGAEAGQAAEEVAGVDKGADSRAASLHSSSAMRVDCLSIVHAKVGKAVEMSAIVYFVVGRMRSENYQGTNPMLGRK